MSLLWLMVWSSLSLILSLDIMFRDVVKYVC